MKPDAQKRLETRLPKSGARPVMHQRWELVLFLHWIVPSDVIQATVPNELTVDTFDGKAYLGLTAFFMTNVRPVGIPALPWLSYFQELNVRTYVYDKSGTAGVWFYSLDCNQPAAVLAARSLLGLPYFHAKMSATKGDWIDYASRRTGTKECARYRYRGTGDVRQVEGEMLEFFLLERYCLYSRHSALDHLLRVRVSHRPYQFRSAEVSQLSNLPAHLDGFSVSQQPDHICMVDALDVKVYYPEKVT